VKVAGRSFRVMGPVGTGACSEIGICNLEHVNGRRTRVRPRGTRNKRVRVLILGVAGFLSFHSPALAALFDVRIEEGVRKTSAGDTVAYELFSPRADPDLPPPPWPAVVLTHGFGRDHRYHVKNAYYMARRGIVVLTADMTSLTLGRPAQVRNIANTADHVVWLQGRALSDHDSLKGSVDPNRIGLAGHSAGGAVSFEAAIHSQRGDIPVAALCLLDGVPWDRTLSRANRLKELPFASLRSEEGVCNFHGKVVSLLGHLKFSTEDIQIVAGTHCDAENPSSTACWLMCGGRNGDGRHLYQRLMYLFFQDALGVVSVEENPETYPEVLRSLAARGTIIRRPGAQERIEPPPAVPPLDVNRN
jgi:pimeloyl-ACP methyl ester carboxylesterase